MKLVREFPVLEVGFDGMGWLPQDPQLGIGARLRGGVVGGAVEAEWCARCGVA
jgi:hypothetical protein